MKGLVLGGGSIKGAFQAGAVCEILSMGFRPRGLFGISTGALNAAFIADRAGAQLERGGEVDWMTVGVELKNFWLANVTSPSDLIVKRSALSLAFSIVGGSFKGLFDVSPLRNIINAEIKPDNIGRYLSAGNFFSIGAVEMYAGQILYWPEAGGDLLDMVLASASIPVAFPVVEGPIGVYTGALVDGGLRDLIPLQRAVSKGFNEVIAVICQPRDFIGGNYNEGNLIRHAERIIDVLLSEIMENDIKAVSERIAISRLLHNTGQSSSEYSNFREAIEPILIRPDGLDPMLDVSIDDFSREQIAEMIQKGEEAARRAYRPKVD